MVMSGIGLLGASNSPGYIMFSMSLVKVLDQTELSHSRIVCHYYSPSLSLAESAHDSSYEYFFFNFKGYKAWAWDLR